MNYLKNENNYLKKIEFSKFKIFSKYVILLITIFFHNYIYSQCICDITYDSSDEGNIPNLTQTSHFTNAENVTISPNENIAFESGSFSLLCPGFVAEYGSVFSSKIESCNASEDCFYTCTLDNGNQIKSIDRGPFLQQLLTDPVTNEATVIIKWRDINDRAYNVELISETGASYFYDETDTELVINNSYRILSLSDLDPNTRYRYNVNYGNSNKASITGYFTTPPIVGSDIPDNDPVSFWVMGDAGDDHEFNIEEMRDAYFDHTGDDAANSEFLLDCSDHFLNTDFIINLGDNAYQSGRDSELQDAVFEPYKKILKYLPLWPTTGNHESDYIFFDSENEMNATGDDIHKRVFELPEVGDLVLENETIDLNELYYSFDYGNIHFVCLYSQFQSVVNPITFDKKYEDNYNEIYQEMFNWLKADLLLAQEDSKWTILFFHKPVLTAGGRSDRSTMQIEGLETDSKIMRSYIDTITNDFDIDLVLYGHNHHYERSYLVRNVDGDFDEDGNFIPSNSNLGPNVVNDGLGGFEILDYGCTGNINCDLPNANYEQVIGNYDHLLNKEAGANNGTVFVTCGASSKKESTSCSSVAHDFFTHPAMRFFSQVGCDGSDDTFINGKRGISKIGSLHFEVENNSLKGTYISKVDNDGNFEVLDEFTIHKNFSNNRLNHTDKILDNKPKFSIVPNPFSQQSTIEFELLNEGEVSIYVSDITGKKLTTLANSQQKTTGIHQVTFNAKDIAPGIYYCTIIAGDKIETQKMVIIK